MRSDPVELPLDRLTAIAERALTRIGVSAADVPIVLPVLMYAQLRGSTQGLIKIVEKTIVASPDATAVSESVVAPSMLSVHGNGNIGMVVLSYTTDRISQIAAEHGLALATTSGTASSTGAIGYYTERLARHGLIGIVMAGSPKTMAAHGGVDPVMGTNPIAISVPMSGDKDDDAAQPLTFDMASAAIPVFGLIAARDHNESIPADLAFDADGKPTDDPGAALSGAIRAFGGAKGGGLALMLEILTGALTGASLPGETHDNRGNLIIGIDPGRLMPTEQFRQRVRALTDTIKASRPEVSGQPVRLPGETSSARAARAQTSGLIRIDPSLLDALEKLAA